MRQLTTRLALGLGMALVAAACGGGATATGGSPASTPAPAGSPASGGEGGWRTSSLVDARTGLEFTIDGLRGRLVAIEPMAIWCSNCRTQQREAVEALAALASEDLVYIGVGVDPNEPPDALAAYADREGFAWTFTVASKDVARSLAAEFGDQVLSPPSTPLILLGADGSVIETHYGIRRADELEALFRQHLP